LKTEQKQAKKSTVCVHVQTFWINTSGSGSTTSDSSCNTKVDWQNSISTVGYGKTSQLQTTRIFKMLLKYVLHYKMKYSKQICTLFINTFSNSIEKLGKVRKKFSV